MVRSRHLSCALLLAGLACGPKPRPIGPPPGYDEGFFEHDNGFTENVYAVRRAHLIEPRRGSSPCQDRATCAAACEQGDGEACAREGDALAVAGDEAGAIARFQAACSHRDPVGCAQLAMRSLDDTVLTAADPLAILYVSCIDGRAAEACSMGASAIQYRMDRAIEAYQRSGQFDPWARAEWTDHTGVPDPAVGSDSERASSGGIISTLKRYACDVLHDAVVCVAEGRIEQACAAGDQPSCGQLTAERAESDKKQAAEDEAAAIAAEEARQRAYEYEIAHWDETHPPQPEEEPVGPVSAADADYLNADECRMAYGFECSKRSLRGEVDYNVCLAAAETHMVGPCQGIRCGARFYNCMANAYSDDDFVVCLSLVLTCGVD